MTPKQYRALQAIWIILDVLLEDTQEAEDVLRIATELLKIFDVVPDYEIINKFLDHMAAKYAVTKSTRD